MVNIVVNAGLANSIISTALTKTGDFRVTELAQAGGGEPERTVQSVKADMLLMNVGLHPGPVTLEEREKQIRAIHKSCPGCKVALLMDTAIGENKLHYAVTLKQAGLIHSFLYADCSAQYLVATLQSMLLE